MPYRPSPPDIHLLDCLHDFTHHAAHTIQAFREWEEAGRPMDNVPAEIPPEHSEFYGMLGREFIALLKLVKAVTDGLDEGGLVVLSEGDVEHALRPVVEKHFGEEKAENLGELVPAVTDQLQGLLCQWFADSRPSASKMDGLATHWAELHQAALADLSLAQEPDEWEPNPSLAAGATDILHQVFLWSVAGQPELLRIEDEQCAKWLATNFEAALFATPWAETFTVPVDVAQLVVLTDPMEVVIAADPTAPPTSAPNA